MVDRSRGSKSADLLESDDPTDCRKPKVERRGRAREKPDGQQRGRNKLGQSRGSYQSRGEQFAKARIADVRVQAKGAHAVNRRAQADGHAEQGGPRLVAGAREKAGSRHEKIVDAPRR